jgi:hypothetical protein
VEFTDVVLKRLRLVLLLTTVAVAFAGASPVAATTQVIDYGSYVKCQYKITQQAADQWTQAKLKHFDVAPPTMKSITSSTQSVGWRFYVRRSKNGAAGPYTTTYRSPWQMSTATPTTKASFSNLGVDVAVPKVSDPQNVHYLVVIVMRWFNGDGSTDSQSNVVLQRMHWIVGSNDTSTQSYCPGLLTN